MAGKVVLGFLTYDELLQGGPGFRVFQWRLSPIVPVHPIVWSEVQPFPQVVLACAFLLVRRSTPRSGITQMTTENIIYSISSKHDHIGHLRVTLLSSQSLRKKAPQSPATSWACFSKRSLSSYVYNNGIDSN